MTNRNYPLIPLVLCTLMTASLAADDSPPPMTANDIQTLAKQLSNWGRWGEQDQLGALNLIDSKKRREAADLVHEGITVSLARNAETQRSPDNPNPYVHSMIATGLKPGAEWSADSLCITYHGYAHTHIDSLCHLFYQGKMYNGFASEEVTQAGAQKLSILNLKDGILTRGVLIDIPALKGVKYLDPSTAILPKDLEAWEQFSRTQVQRGDAVIIRTGRWARRDEKGPWKAGGGAAGLHASCAAWLKARDIAILGSDAASDVLPSGIEGVSHPVHLLMLNSMGVHILDNCDLEALSRQCHQLQRWDFMLTASPLPVQGATGSPLNPIATF